MNYDKGKYLVGEIPLTVGSNLGAVVIGEHFGHAVLRSVFVPDTIVRGGFFFIDEDGKVVVYGESISMKVKSKDIDALLVAKAIGVYKEGVY